MHQLTDVEKRLLALHYVLPIPMNRLENLYKIDPELVDYQNYSAEELVRILRITLPNAVKLKMKLQQSRTTPYEELYKRHEITPIPFTNPLYPSHLLSLFDPPSVLYMKGDIRILTEKYKIAIIGSRKATVYSKQALELIVPPLVENDVVIVSGLAKGADTMAHKAAIAYGGKTIAVLGHGLFHMYPAENRQLAKEIAENQLLLTEYPPYVTPERWTFPNRNRIISGLSDAVIVTEAADRSGTMSTVEHALENGKEVYAVPGSITSELSGGPNKLIDEGARPLWSGYQVIDALTFIHS
ncbi:DNA-processing protein DprA [Sporosarcina sp. FA9]|uniref:DNA-processing protein DprA n=1 Tax=Sporosarcina sp. FA9 TaxID=3413030 RepID=UPI003F655E00